MFLKNKLDFEFTISRKIGDEIKLFTFVPNEVTEVPDWFGLALIKARPERYEKGEAPRIDYGAMSYDEVLNLKEEDIAKIQFNDLFKVAKTISLKVNNLKKEQIVEYIVTRIKELNEEKAELAQTEANEEDNI